MSLSEEARRRGLERAQEARSARARGDLPPLLRIADYKAAIREKCVECMGGLEPMPMADIRRCNAGPGSSAPCPLHPLRPYK